MSHENQLRLKFLAYDLEKMIKVEQKRKKQEAEAANLERLQRLKEQQAKDEQLAKEQQEKEQALAAQQKIIDEQNEQADDKGKDGGEAQPAEGVASPKKQAKPGKEEQKHADSDAEKSDDNDWQDEESEGSGSPDSAEESAANRADVDALANSGRDGDSSKADDGQDPRLKRLAELGCDLALLESDPELVDALIASANLQEEQPRAEEQKRKEEEAAEKKRREEERIKRQKEEELELLKTQGLLAEKVQYHNLRVLHGVQSVTDDQQVVAPFKFLTTRVADSESQELTERCKAVLKDIHQDFQEQSADHIGFPEQPMADQLGEYDITIESIKNMEYEEFEQSCSVLVTADVVLFFRLLESQGYDYWLQKQAFASFMPSKRETRKLDKSLIEKLKEFVEISFCEEKKVIAELEPYQLRLLSKVKDA